MSAIRICPYRTYTEVRPAILKGHGDVTVTGFMECLKEQCPAFRTEERYSYGLGNTDPNEHCLRLEGDGMSDTISRQAAIDALRKMQTYKMFSGDDMLLIDQAGAQTELMLLPPIQPKRGRWIYKTDLITVPTGYWECSECKEGRLLYEANFCPNCGADMREATE